MVDRAEFRTVRRWLAPTTLLAVLLLALPAGAVAQQGQALVRVVHLAAGAPKVDVYVDGTRMIAAVPFKTASKYHRMPASTHMLVLRPAGAADGCATALQASCSLPGVNLLSLSTSA